MTSSARRRPRKTCPDDFCAARERDVRAVVSRAVVPADGAAVAASVVLPQDAWKVILRGTQASRGAAYRSLALLAALAACRLEPAPLQRAALLSSRGRDQEAIATLREHLARDADAFEAHRMLIRLYGSVGQLEAARAQTERLADRLGPSDPVPWIELGHAYELAHRYDDALGAYDRAAEVAPSDPLGPKRGGVRAARWGELALAEPRLEEALRRAPGDADAWHALGVVRVGLGKLDAARAAYSSGLLADPKRLENRLGLATVALRLREPRAALEQYERLLEARPTYVDALLGKAWSLIEMGELDAAEQVLATAHAQGADSVSVARQRSAIAARRTGAR